MTLTIHSDASFLVAPEAKSCIAGFFSLQQPLHTSTQNAPILMECKTLKRVVTSAVECETAAAFHNAQQAIPIQNILNQKGHPQPATPLIMDQKQYNSQKIQILGYEILLAKRTNNKATLPILMEKIIWKPSRLFHKTFPRKISQKYTFHVRHWLLNFLTLVASGGKYYF